ncbi:hypothetical protein AE42_03466 [Enterobacter kobei]|nr:hypothetical protein AE42_03466 [Enterobacter kobei]
MTIDKGQLNRRSFLKGLIALGKVRISRSFLPKLTR